jgi:hypothetical protein
LGFVENEKGVTVDFINGGKFEIEVNGVRYPTKAPLRPLYDPKGEQIRNQCG